jgi:hypothetical protein
VIVDQLEYDDDPAVVVRVKGEDQPELVVEPYRACPCTVASELLKPK